jgi:L-lactate dehydrogenase complex protein LldG
MSNARINILNRLKVAQEKRGEVSALVPDFTSPIYNPLLSSLEQEFKTRMEFIGGRVIFCNSITELSEQLNTILLEKQHDQLFCPDKDILKLLDGKINAESDELAFPKLSIGLTGCEFLVAHLGSVVVSSAQTSGRRMNVFPETHVIIAQKDQIVDYLDTALEKLQEKYKNNLPSLISNITGPSRTADIEKTLVMGMHGPKSLIVIIVEEQI